MGIKHRIAIESDCDDCSGLGKVSIETDPGTWEEAECSGCDGTGWTVEYISIGDLKNLLEEA